MNKIPQRLRELAIGMFNAGMTMNTVAMNIGFSTRAIRHLRQCFQKTGRTEDRPRNGRPCVTTRGQNRYYRNTHQRNRFQTATATAANTHDMNNNRISAPTVRGRGPKCTSSTCWLCFGATSPRKSCTLVNARLDNNRIPLFSLACRGLPSI